MRKLVALISVCFATLWLAVPNAADAGGTHGTAAKFGKPVVVTPTAGYGYEPAVYIDRFGNIFATAHKENWQLAVAPDTNSPTVTRAMSWAWWSTDNGKTFKNIPGFPGSAENHVFGDEGDMALDDANHLYFVDTNVTDITFTRWTIQGRGKISIDTHRPILPAAEPVDDRPWVTAHGNGHVFYFGNEGNKTEYTLGQGRKGNGNGPGRYTSYKSTDAGDSFDTTGYTLNDSGWCRPLAEPNTKRVYAICTNDGSKMYAFVSNDDGDTFSRHDMGTINGGDPYQSWPTVAVAPDGTLYALYVDGVTAVGGVEKANKLVLFTSRNHGTTWSHQDITDMPGRYEYNWLAVGGDGRTLGLGTYYRKNNNSDWYVYGAMWKPGQKPKLAPLDPKNPVQNKACDEAPGDLLGTAIGPDGHLSVMWTRNLLPDTCGTATAREIRYARSL